MEIMSHYSEKKDLFPMQGGCPCGHIRYTLSLPPLLVHCCHCTVCQRQLGTAFALNAIIEASAITLLPPSPPTPCSLKPFFVHLTNGLSTTPTEGEVKVHEPILVTFPSESGIGQTVAQCPICHTGLWSLYCSFGSEAYYLRAGTLDNAGEINPDVHIFTRSRRDFITINDGKPQFEGFYPDRSALYRPETSARWEALEVKEQAWRAQFKDAMAKE